MLKDLYDFLCEPLIDFWDIFMLYSDAKIFGQITFFVILFLVIIGFGYLVQYIIKYEKPDYDNMANLINQKYMKEFGIIKVGKKSNNISVIKTKHHKPKKIGFVLTNNIDNKKLIAKDMNGSGIATNSVFLINILSGENILVLGDAIVRDIKELTFVKYLVIATHQELIDVLMCNPVFKNWIYNNKIIIHFFIKEKEVNTDLKIKYDIDFSIDIPRPAFKFNFIAEKLVMAEIRK